MMKAWFKRMLQERKDRKRYAREIDPASFKSIAKELW